jgi:predicted acylesterase/phospholipase RssA
VADRLLFVSGHRTDETGRPRPRFPEDRVATIQRRIAGWLTARNVDPSWTLLTGGTRGADLIAAEEALRLGASVRLCLALEPDEFVQHSVLGGTRDAEWEQRFRYVLGHATAEVVPAAPPTNTGTTSVYARANQVMLDQLAAADEAHALLVWDGASGSSGGTGEVAAAAQLIVRGVGGRFGVIDPTPRAYEARQRRDGPKKILALTGGGLRGVISLEILATIEDQLRTALGSPNLVLADYFDYLAGTSTGAIIATGLALGKPVEEIRTRYHELGKLAFRRSLTSLRYLSRFGDTGVTEQLEAWLGNDLTLGDPRLRTLLLLVLHRIDSDSAWLLSNCTRAKYNRTERFMTPGGADRNLDLPLIKLIRGSTAAPTYFPPETIQVGPHQVRFQDGGVTAFNNPALIAAVMATLPVYGLGWPTGSKDLLVVSVGTGMRAQVATKRSWAPLESLANLGRLPTVLMNGSAFSQDLLSRVMGDCRFGTPLDREVGTLTGELFTPDDPDAWEEQQEISEKAGIPAIGQYFRYVHYDINLGAAELTAAEVARKDWSAVAAMDNHRQIPNWQRLGQLACRDVAVSDHFAGFLPTTARPDGS